MNLYFSIIVYKNRVLLRARDKRRPAQLAYQLTGGITSSPGGSSRARNGDFQGFSGPTLDSQADRVAGPVLADFSLEFPVGLDELAIHRQDDVSLAQVGLESSAICLWLPHQYATFLSW